jgi:diacylglycerol kinase
MKPDKFSFKSRFESFGFALNGLLDLFRNEHNSRIHLLAAIGAIALGIFLKINQVEWCLVIMVIGIVFLTELLNSSLETLADVVDPELNEKIRKAKDYAAAAVLISAVLSVVIGGIIFIPKILAFL